MTTTPGNASSNLPGKPPVVDLATWQAARDELLVREKAHTREGDAIAAARRRLPMVELDGAVEVTGVDGPVPFVDVFDGSAARGSSSTSSMWYDGQAPHSGPVRGLHLQRPGTCKTPPSASTPGASRSPSVTSGVRGTRWRHFVEFMGYDTLPWYSVRGVEESLFADEGHIICYLRGGDRVFAPIPRPAGAMSRPTAPGPARHDALRPP